MWNSASSSFIPLNILIIHWETDVFHRERGKIILSGVALERMKANTRENQRCVKERREVCLDVIEPPVLVTDILGAALSCCSFFNS